MTTVLAGRDLLSLADLTPGEVRLILSYAAQEKAAWAVGQRVEQRPGKSVSLIFQKPSMRTRVSFEVACARLGCHPVTLVGGDSAMSRDESVYDTAKVLERYVDAIVIRTFRQSLIEEMAEHAEVPVINALTDDFHPCQGLADLMTIKEHKGELDGVSLAYVGDGNNMAHTYMLGGALVGMNVRLSCPDGFGPKEEIIEHARSIASTTGASIDLVSDPREAVEGIDVVVTDTWASMGQEDERSARLSAFKEFSVDTALLALADEAAIFMHCLPAHRGEEVTDAVIDSAQSVVFDEAENRLHAQQALLALVLS